MTDIKSPVPDEVNILKVARHQVEPTLLKVGTFLNISAAILMNAVSPPLQKFPTLLGISDAYKSNIVNS